MKYKYIIFEIRYGNMREHKENVPLSNIEMNYGLGSEKRLLRRRSEKRLLQWRSEKQRWRRSVKQWQRQSVKRRWLHDDVDEARRAAWRRRRRRQPIEKQRCGWSAAAAMKWEAFNLGYLWKVKSWKVLLLSMYTRILIMDFVSSKQTSHSVCDPIFIAYKGVFVGRIP